MQDRVSLYPGRVTLTPVAGQANTYDMVRADQPTQEGTQLNKGNLLSDETAALYGLSADATPNQVFGTIFDLTQAIIGNYAIIHLAVVDSAGLPAKNVAVSGVTTADGDALYTDQNGIISGRIEAGSTTLSVSGYADLVDHSEAVTAQAGGVVSKTITLTRRTELSVATSTSIRFSGNVASYDVSLVGGGAGGQAGYVVQGTGAKGGHGGGGGHVTNALDQTPVPNGVYVCTVGAGGGGGSQNSQEGSAGGTTSVSVDGSTLHSASGGSANGTGNGTGGIGFVKRASVDTEPTAGTAGGTRLFGESSNILPGGGGGGGNMSGAGYLKKSGGAQFGGAGAGGTSSTAPVAGSAPGGGGGGGSPNSAADVGGARGGDGRIYFRMEVA